MSHLSSLNALLLPMHHNRSIKTNSFTMDDDNDDDNDNGKRGGRDGHHGGDDGGGGGGDGSGKGRYYCEEIGRRDGSSGGSSSTHSSKAAAKHSPKASSRRPAQQRSPKPAARATAAAAASQPPPNALELTRSPSSRHALTKDDIGLPTDFRHVAHGVSPVDATRTADVASAWRGAQGYREDVVPRGQTVPRVEWDASPGTLRAR
jgi:hypothetical protein